MTAKVPYRTWLADLKVGDPVVVVKQHVCGENTFVPYTVEAVLKRSIRVGPWHFSNRTGGLLRLPGCTAWIERQNARGAK